MPEASFAKFHGLGNDFVMIDGIATPMPSVSSDQARYLADRRHGIGADQVLLLTKGDDDEFCYRIWNQDGGEVAQCGNGARSAHAFLRRRGYAEGRTRLRTSAGLLEVEDGKRGPRAYLGVPSFEPSEIPLARKVRLDSYPLSWQGYELSFAAVAVGNPHCVFWVKDVNEAPVAELGEYLNSSEDFPEGVNVSFACKTAKDKISLRVHERGVGETPACGSAAAACAAIACDPSTRVFEIVVQGGDLLAGWEGEEAKAWVEGEVSHVFDGTIEIR